MSRASAAAVPPPRPRRSALYMPGANARALEKARTLPADCLLLDLEDAVAPDAKAQARDAICASLQTGGYAPREVVVRINALDTAWGADDAAALARLDASARPDAVLVPKISLPDDVHNAARHIPPDCALWVMIETPQAIFNVAALAALKAHTSLACFVMGTNDLTKELHAHHSAGRAPLMTSLSLAVLAARQYDLTILDGVFNDIEDAAGFLAECQQGVAMGFDGKTLIHPRQIDICNTQFAPSEAELDEARAIVAAFADPENAGHGVLRVGGKMTELLHRDIAARKLAIADAIAATKSESV